ncbi:hypothetical protein FACS1894186_5050 [Alphaproteobacteria bacterium]|nr:hypothetical protein FACS1894186_5050 [Alphaproteobacteria bacterium]
MELAAVIRMIGALAFVAGLIVLAAWGAKRRWPKGLPGAARRRMRVVEALPLDARRRLLLVRVDAREYLVCGDTVRELGEAPPDA